MNRKRLVAATAALVVLATLAAILIRRQDPEETASEASTEAAAAGGDLAAGLTLTMDLFFPSTGGWLSTERRDLPAGEGVEERITAVLASLIAGPSNRGLRSPLPEGTGVRKVYLATEGVAYVDFESPENMPPASGSQREMLIVYSLVNTVLLNFEELDRVVLLWNGRQLKTFSGHVDTMRPLAARIDLVARDTRGASGAAP